MYNRPKTKAELKDNLMWKNSLYPLRGIFTSIKQIKRTPLENLARKIDTVKH